MSSNPFMRSGWDGVIVSVDGASAEDFGPDDCDEIIADEEWGGRWDGYMAGLARLKDGRFVAWDDSYGPTGDGFCRDAYGGDATIYVGKTLAAVVRLGLGDEARGYLWKKIEAWLELDYEKTSPVDATADVAADVLPQPPPKPAEGDVWAEIIDALKREDHDDPLLPYAVARRQMGIDKYGTPLQRENGRSHRADALQEALDGMAYSRADGDAAVAGLFETAARLVLMRMDGRR